MSSTFKFKTDVSRLRIRDFNVATESNVNPLDANALVCGEWLTLNTSGAALRASSGAGTDHQGTTPAWPAFFEKGQTDVQATKKVPLVLLGQYDAETTICTTATGDVGHPALVFGDPLAVGDVNDGGVIRRGLVYKTEATAVTVAYVLQVLGTNHISFIRA